MPLWIKRFPDWAMRELWPLFRTDAAIEPVTLSYSWEKAGLTRENQPIPWNADQVFVEAVVNLPRQAAHGARDVTLRLSGQSRPIRLDTCEKTGVAGCARLSFRFPAPSATSVAEVCANNRSLGQVTLPVFSKRDFLAKLALRMPTLAVCLGEQTVACRTFVGSQCLGLIVSAVLASPFNLAPIPDLGLRVELRRPDGEMLQCAPVHLSATQQAAQQSLVTASFPRPRRQGAWEIVWLIEDTPLGALRIRSISKPQFQRSLRLASARFVVDDGTEKLSVQPALPDSRRLRRIGPCFLLTSTEPGMAGLCTVQVRAKLTDALESFLLQEEQTLITDGPTPLISGTLDAAEGARMEQFELRVGRQILGVLPMKATPTACFDSEGGFVAPKAFAWSDVAEGQLREKLTKLLGK